jgi:SnoaL-like domain
MDNPAQIRNLISLYAICLDTKAFPTLVSGVFTRDAAADFTAAGLGSIAGGEAIAATLAGFLKDVDTQHQLTTQRIILTDTAARRGEGDMEGGKKVGSKEGKVAYAVTYVQASHFGRGEKQGKRWDVYAWYEDEIVWGQELEKSDNAAAVDIATSSGNGGWRIKKRKIGMHVSFPSPLLAFSSFAMCFSLFNALFPVPSFRRMTTSPSFGSTPTPRHHRTMNSTRKSEL